MNAILPFLLAIAGVLIIYLLYRPDPVAKREGARRLLTYRLRIRIFSALCIPLTLFVCYAAAHARSSQLLPAALVSTAFILITIFLIYQVFTVHIAWDDDYIYYQSPFAGKHRIAWTDVEDIDYSPLTGSHYLQTPPVRRIYCSPLHGGYDELGEFLLYKTLELQIKNHKT